MADWTPPAEAKPAETAWKPPAEAKPADAPSVASRVDDVLSYHPVYNLAKNAVPPLVNTFIADPMRNLVGDVVGAVRSPPISAEGREGFWKAREAAIADPSASWLHVPQTATGDRLSRMLGVPGALIGGVAHKMGDMTGTRETLGPAATVVGDALPFVGALGASRFGGAVPGAVSAATKGAGDLWDTLLMRDGAAAAEKFVERAYDKAIRPTVVGKGTSPKMQQADQNVVSHLSSIIANKENLRLADNKGREVMGRNPRSLDEYAQAIAQTKRPVFDTYDRLARQGDALGVSIDPTPAVVELRKFAADPSFALPAFKDMREYATATAASLEAGGPLLPSVAQGMVRNLNEGLSGFYRASSPEAASKAAVNDLVANQLRQHVDSALEQAGLPGWQEARHKLGALIEAESEVAHRAGVYGRQDAGGGLFGRLGTIASYEELARFAVSHDPAALAAAAAIRGGRKFLEMWHGPNLTVRRMFNKAEKYDLQPDARGGRAGTSDPTGGMQPPRPSGPGQNASGGTSTGVASGGTGSASAPIPMGPGAVGPQPGRTGPAQDLTGTQGGGVLQGGGSAIPAVRGPAVPPRPAPADPFLTPPGGGRVSQIDPDAALARMLGLA